jgi:hypothetical protein
METFTRQDLMQLIKDPQAPCISIFLATKRGGAGRSQDHAAFKNLLREAGQALAALGVAAAAVRSRLASLEALLGDRDFWSKTGRGIAVFSDAGGMRAWRLPTEVADRVVVGKRFFVLPLIPLLPDAHRFYVLALSQNAVQLYQGDGDGLLPLPAEGMPASLAEALRYNNIQPQALSRSTPGHGSTQYSAQGAATEEDTENLERLVRPIVRALEGVVKKEPLPIVVAATERLAGALRQFGSALPLAKEIVHGNPDRLSAAELHAKAWAMLAPEFEAERRHAVERYTELDGTVRASRGLEEILRAADEGRVWMLLLEAGAERWGALNPASGTVSVHAQAQSGDEELLDRAAAATLGHRGQIWVLPKEELPAALLAGSPVAAVYRY